MRFIIVLLVILAYSTATLTAQQPPALPDPSAIKLDLPPTQNFAPPPPAQVQMNSAPTLPIQPVSNTSNGPVKSGDTVRALRSTIIRSGPSDQSYACNTLDVGHPVVVLELPGYGSSYTAIAAPDNCYSLIPEGAIYVLYRPSNFFTAPQPVRYLTESLIDGEPGSGEYLVSSYKLPKGSPVWVVSEKKIKVLGKLKNYCVIRTGGKSIRYVRTADLEGVEEAARQAQQGLNNSPLNNNSNNNWPGSSVQHAAEVSEHLPPQLAGQVQAADKAYQSAIRTGAWEDALMRYQYLMESDVLSVRILAKNRLEFIREWQHSPPVQTSAMSPQQNNYAPPPAPSRDAWVPGEVAARLPRPVASPTSMQNPVKEVVVRPTPPAAAPPSSPLHIPTYQDAQPAPRTTPPPPAATAPVNQPYTQPQQQPQPQQQQPPLPATPPTAQRVKTLGKLSRHVNYSGPNQLYYMTNSQGILTYYIRGVGAASQQLAASVGKIIEVEGMSLQAPIDGQLKSQINAERIKLLQ